MDKPNDAPDLSDEFYVTDDHLLVSPIKDDYNKSPAGVLYKVAIKNAGFTPLTLVRGFVVRKGDGYPIYSEKNDLTRAKTYDAVYIPLKVEVGNEVLFIENQNGVFSITLEGKAYFLIRQSNVLIARRHNFTE